MNIKHRHLFFFAWVAVLSGSTVPFFARADEISTDVQAEARVSHLWRASHPAKLFKCWGKPEEAETWMDRREDVSRGKNEGRLETEAQGRGKVGFQDYRPQTLTWKAELSKERDLSLEFRQDVRAAQTSYIHHQCSTQRFVSKLDGVRNRLSSQARLQVPDGVWLLRIQKSVETREGRSYQDLSASVSGVDEVVSGLRPNESGQGRALRLAVGDAEYLLVEPGSQIDFKIAWSSEEPRNLAFNVKYQIRMIGVDDCRRHFGSPSEFGERANEFLLERDFREDLVSKDPQAFIEKMSCLRNGDYLQSLMYSQHGRKLAALFGRLNTRFAEWMTRRNAPKDFDVIELTTRMSLLEGARWLMKDLLLYCDVRDVRSLFGLAPETRVKYRGYQAMARSMAQVKYLLDVVPADLSEAYVSLVEKLAAKGETYSSSLASPLSLPILRNLHDTLMDNEFMVFDPIRGLLEELQDVRSGRKDRVSAKDAALRALDASRRFQDELRVSFQRFGRREQSRVDARSLRDAWNILKSAHSGIRKGLAQDLEWFLGKSDDLQLDYPPFTKDLMTVNQDLLKSVSDTLAETHASKLDGKFERLFLKREETEKMYREAAECLRSSDGN